jgi:hypothetical protein
MTDNTKSDKDMHKSGWMIPTSENYSDEEEIGQRISVLLPTQSPNNKEEE